MLQAEIAEINARIEAEKDPVCDKENSAVVMENEEAGVNESLIKSYDLGELILANGDSLESSHRD